MSSSDSSSQPAGRALVRGFLLGVLLGVLLVFLLDVFLPLPLPLPAGRGGRWWGAWSGAEQMSACGTRRLGHRVRGCGVRLGRCQGNNCRTSSLCHARVSSSAEANQEQGAARCTGSDDNRGLFDAHAGDLDATARCWWRCLNGQRRTVGEFGGRSLV